MGHLGYMAGCVCSIGPWGKQSDHTGAKGREEGGERSKGKRRERLNQEVQTRERERGWQLLYLFLYALVRAVAAVVVVVVTVVAVESMLLQCSVTCSEFVSPFSFLFPTALSFVSFELRMTNRPSLSLILSL